MKILYLVVFFFNFLGWGDAESTVWPIVSAPDDRWRVWSSRRDENWQGKQVLEEKRHQCHFFHNKSHITWSGLRPWPPQWLTDSKERNTSWETDSFSASQGVPWISVSPNTKVYHHQRQLWALLSQTCQALSLPYYFYSIRFNLLSSFWKI
jgi:hypothetical protein